ncbi:uncharacterized protein LOC124799206 [Schistocerca piceifrons]|uniref:uncharacterized protein LOC124799206 n=1 Tax=Schistocerca piceifrons TaxID=274613 RepID=UPI001F5F3910|nr:uncharacterized protein LOC124799206 [Schistocerca piceifrons]
MRREIKAAVEEHRNCDWADLVATLNPQDGNAWRVVKSFLRRRQQVPQLQAGQMVVCSPDGKAGLLADHFESSFTSVDDNLDVAHIVEEELPIFLAAEPTIYPARGQPDVLDVTVIKGIGHHTTASTWCALSSDHLPVVFDIDVAGATLPPRRQTYRRMDCERFQEMVLESIVNTPDPDCVSSPATYWLRDFSRNLPPPIWKAIREKNRLFREWQLTRQPATERRLNRMRRDIKAVAEVHRNSVWSAFVASLNPEDGSIWHTVKSFLRRRQRIPPILFGQDVVCSPDGKAGVLADQFQLSFTPVDDNLDEDHIQRVAEQLPVFLEARDDWDVIEAISKAEVAAQLKALNTRKVRGADGVTNHLLRNLPANPSGQFVP